MKIHAGIFQSILFFVLNNQFGVSFSLCFQSLILLFQFFSSLVNPSYLPKAIKFLSLNRRTNLRIRHHVTNLWFDEQSFFFHQPKTSGFGDNQMDLRWSVKGTQFFITSFQLTKIDFSLQHLNETLDNLAQRQAEEDIFIFSARHSQKRTFENAHILKTFQFSNRPTRLGKVLYFTINNQLFITQSASLLSYTLQVKF